MSSYLVAFVVSNFKTIKKNSSKYNILMEVAARPEAIDRGEGEFALKEGGLIIDYFADLFDIKYPIKKMSKCRT